MTQGMATAFAKIRLALRGHVTTHVGASLAQAMQLLDTVISRARAHAPFMCLQSIGSSDELARSLQEEMEAINSARRAYPNVLDSALKDQDAVQNVRNWLDVCERISEADPGCVLHFGCHGEDGTLCLEDKPHPNAFAEKIARCQPKCVVLNACETRAFATAVRKRCPEAVLIFWDSPVRTSVAVAFSGRFYRELCRLRAEGQTDARTYEDACSEARLYLHGNDMLRKKGADQLVFWMPEARTASLATHPFLIPYWVSSLPSIPK